MESAAPGQLVKVDIGGPQLDGIVFDMPSSAKAIVAIVDRARGPVLRTVAASTLSEREQEGADDRALQFLIRRTPAPAGGSGRGTAGSQQGRSGHTRAATHRTTGR